MSTSMITAAENRLHAMALQLAKTSEEQNDGAAAELTIIRLYWMEELRASSSFTVLESEEIVRLAVVELSQRKTGNKSDTSFGKSAPMQPSSVSLWDQFQPSSFSERVLWSDIQQARETMTTTTTPEQLLTLLQKVDHIDDLLGGDWIDACTVLQKGLSASKIKPGCYLELHRKWFAECQATAEYQSIRFDLCRNVWQAVSDFFDQYSTTSNKNDDDDDDDDDDELLFDLLQTWKSMWIEITTTAGSDSDDRIDDMVIHVLQQFSRKAFIDERNSSSQEKTAASPAWQQQPCVWLALVDPTADWFQCWLEDTPIPRILPVLTQLSNNRIITVLLDRCVAQPTTNNNAVSQPNKVHHLSLAMLSAIIMQLRVRMFPWDQVVPISEQASMQQDDESNITIKPDEGNEVATWSKDFPKPHSLEQVLALAKFFLVDEQQHQQQRNDDILVVKQCRRALDVLLCGCAAETDPICYRKIVELIDMTNDSGTSPSN